MAQAEDVELRDLVIDALEKNGSLAKIRALLRANIFLAFEDERESIKQNVSLDRLLNLPEGALCLSIVHEFLEFCNLRNTLFVFMSESRQGNEYTYDGGHILYEKLNLNKQDGIEEPVLLTLLKKVLKYDSKLGKDDIHNRNKSNNDSHYRDNQNYTYIVQEDSSSQLSQTNSDNSYEEKNKLRLRLHLDNSDTDTSSDSAREKTSSEYIANEHIILKEESNKEKISRIPNYNINSNTDIQFPNSSYVNENFSQNDPTSYMILKKSEDHGASKNVPNSTKMNSATLSSISSMSYNYENDGKKHVGDKCLQNNMQKSDSEMTDYSYDFTSSPTSNNKYTNKIHESVQENANKHLNKSAFIDSPHSFSQSSQSSVSISDVAELVEFSDRNSPANSKTSSEKRKREMKDHSNSEQNRLKGEGSGSGSLSELTVPSLSKLSLDIHSD